MNDETDNREQKYREVTNIKQLYSELYTEIEKITNISKLSHFVAMKGKFYDYLSSPTDVRLMIVGRAINGWESFPAKSAEEFGNAAQTAFNTQGFS